MRNFLNHIKNETLDEIKTSLENLWQRMIQLSEFFQYSFVLILKRKCLVGAGRVRCGESGTPSIIIYTRCSSRRYEHGCDAPMILIEIYTFSFEKMHLQISSEKRRPFCLGLNVFKHSNRLHCLALCTRWVSNRSLDLVIIRTNMKWHCKLSTGWSCWLSGRRKYRIHGNQTLNS